MEDERLRHDLFLLLGYLLTSAHGLYNEPASYGPLRLTDAAGRLLSIMESHGLSDAFLQKLRGAIAPECFMTTTDDQWRTTLDELVVQYASELAQRSEQ